MKYRPMHDKEERRYLGKWIIFDIDIVSVTVTL